MKIAIAADHGGFPLKADIVELLKQAGHEPTDLGAHTYSADDDYPDYAVLVAKAIQAGQAERGIVICGSGVGACIAANKLQGIRAGVCHDTYSAHQVFEQITVPAIGRTKASAQIRQVGEGCFVKSFNQTLQPLEFITIGEIGRAPYRERVCEAV
jgi:RpiB/LacA/LacB family sugar-phosphate isomerase